MDYAAELCAFYTWVDTSLPTTSEIVLWHAVMQTLYQSRCSKITIPTCLLEMRTGLKRTAIYQARNSLKQKGRIDFVSGKGSTTATYWVLPFYSDDEGSDIVKFRRRNVKNDVSMPFNEHKMRIPANTNYEYPVKLGSERIENTYEDDYYEDEDIEEDNNIITPQGAGARAYSRNEQEYLYQWVLPNCKARLEKIGIGADEIERFERLCVSEKYNPELIEVAFRRTFERKQLYDNITNFVGYMQSCLTRWVVAGIRTRKELEDSERNNGIL